MEKEIETILNNKDGLIGKHQVYTGKNLIVGKINDLSAELKIEKALNNMGNDLIQKVLLKINKKGKLYKNYGLYHIRKELDTVIIIKKKSFLGFIYILFIKIKNMIVNK